MLIIPRATGTVLFYMTYLLSPSSPLSIPNTCTCTPPPPRFFLTFKFCYMLNFCLKGLLPLYLVCNPSRSGSSPIPYIKYTHGKVNLSPTWPPLALALALTQQLIPGVPKTHSNFFMFICLMITVKRLRILKR